MKSDMQLHKDVLAELTWDPRVAHKEIAIAAKDGVVTLTGSVPSFAERWAADRAVEPPIPRVGDREDRGNGPAHRVAARTSAA